MAIPEFILSNPDKLLSVANIKKIFVATRYRVMVEYSDGLQEVLFTGNDSSEQQTYYDNIVTTLSGTAPTSGATMQPYYGNDLDPNGIVTPADITLPAYYIGDNRTYYIWDTVGQASWIGLITV
jgi:hypothetical protein